MPFGSQRPSGRVREFKTAARTACLIVAITAMTGCGLMPFGEKEESQTPVAPPPSAMQPMNSADSQYGGMSDSLPVTPLQSGLSPEEMAMTPESIAGLEGYEQVPAPEPAPIPPFEEPDPLQATGPLQMGPDGTLGSLGFNLDGYFDPAAPPEERITRVERAVSAMQRDLRTLAPPIMRLASVEQDIQELVTQLSQLAQNQSPPRAMNTAYNAAPLQAPPRGSVGSAVSAAPPPQAASPPRQSGGTTQQAAGGPVTVHKLRLGEHPDKTRIVLDVSGKATYRYDLDNAEHLLVIELPDASWSGGATSWQGGSKSPVLASYSVMPTDSGGTRVIVQLKKDTSISYESVIRPNGYKDYRIVLDLKK